MAHTRIFALGMALVALLLAPAFADPPSNAFAGSWAGTYDITSEGGATDSGSIAFDVSASGAVSGGGTQESGRPFTLTGHIKDDGSYHFAYQINDGSASFGGPISGEATIDDEGNLVATIDELVATGVAWAGDMTLAP